MQFGTVKNKHLIIGFFFLLKKVRSTLHEKKRLFFLYCIRNQTRMTEPTGYSRFFDLRTRSGKL